MSNSSATKRLLNLGSGKHKLPGFINIDARPGADLIHDLSTGLPFENNSVHGIHSEHFMEHLPQSDGVALLRECRRVLVDGGRVRVAMPDLDYAVEVYNNPEWRTINPEWVRYGFNWIDSRAEQLNLAMRLWDHKWLYNEEELVRLAQIAGLAYHGRRQHGQSDWPEFRGLEYREGSRLICEFTKQRATLPPVPLVSILIPAFNAKFLAAALDSALGQTYRDTEIIVADDNPSSEAIRDIVTPRAAADGRIRYVRNPANLGGRGRANFLQCFDLARGELIKYLNDDDILHPDCIQRMVESLQRFPDATLVTCVRSHVDAHGAPLPSGPPLVQRDSILDGVALAAAMLKRRANLVGGPSMTLFRKSDLAGTRPNIISFAGREAIVSGDLTMWVNLLSKGDGICLAQPLCHLRQHPEQGQRNPEYQKLRSAAMDQLVFDGERMGLLKQMKARRTPVRTIQP